MRAGANCVRLCPRREQRGYGGVVICDGLLNFRLQSHTRNGRPVGCAPADTLKKDSHHGTDRQFFSIGWLGPVRAYRRGDRQLPAAPLDGQASCWRTAQSIMQRCNSMHALQSILFTSQCPKCKREQQQTGYTRDSLVELLNTGRAVEAYCDPCRVTWPISHAERTGIARRAIAR